MKNVLMKSLLPSLGTLVLLAGCASNSPDVTVAPGTTVNSGKSQCKYQITRVPLLTPNCGDYADSFICIEVCTPPSTTPPCNMAGIKIVDIGVILGKPADYLKCSFTLTLIDCSVCLTATPDGTL